MPAALLIGLGAFAAALVAVFASRRSPSSSNNTPDSLPEARKKGRVFGPVLPPSISGGSTPKKGPVGKKPIVTFTPVSVPWMRKRKGDGELVQVSNKAGKPLFRSTIKETPTELQEAAEEALGRKTTASAFALATMIASEGGDLPLKAKVGLAHTAWNESKRRGLHITELLAPDGAFGSQQGRYASTRKPPSEEDILVAEGAIEGRIPDPTGGAIQFDSPQAQRKGVAEKWSGYTSTDTDVAAQREAEGKEAVYLDGVSADKLRFWRPTKKRPESLAKEEGGKQREEGGAS